MVHKKGWLILLVGLVLTALLLSAGMPAQAAGGSPRPRSNFLLRYLPKFSSSIYLPSSSSGVVAPLAMVTPTPSQTTNPICLSLGFPYELKIDNPALGETTLDFVKINYKNIGGIYQIDWESTRGIDLVIVKAGAVQSGGGAYFYSYSPEAFADTNLTTPDNKALSHISFCYDYEVEVSKTADPSFTRTYSWTIDKGGDQTELKLAVGETYPVNYTVKVDSTYTDSDWAVSGTITITNPDPNYPAVITSVSDVISGDIVPTMSCGVTFPYTLAKGGGTITCTYSTSLSDGTSRTNTATVAATISGTVKQGNDTYNFSNDASGSAKKDFAFVTPTSEVDECITVSDDKYGSLGKVCYNDLPKTFSYSLNVSYAVCGDYEFVNTASFATNDTGTTGSDSWTVKVSVPCAGGCTLTQGYWKTHSIYGPAPYDDTWALVGEDTLFFNSGLSWYKVLWTPPSGGNVYFILAHQYIAAKMNILNGADGTAVSSALSWAENFFNTYTPTSTLSKLVKNEAAKVAAQLDQYNNGLIGPGHCSE